MNQIKLSVIAIALIAFAASCKKSDVQAPPVNTVKDSVGLYVLNQGQLNHNNTTLTFFNLVDSAVSTGDYFNDVNGFGLGDTGDDFIIYGGKMYIVMNASGYLAVINPYTTRFIDSISFISGATNKGPENIVAYQGNVFVSASDGTVSVIDTTTLAITKSITVGTNPAQMAIAGNNLYVSNTGGIDAITTGIYDSTLSVINLTSLTETGTIKVGSSDPGYMAIDDSGNLYVACAGNYNSATDVPKLVKVNTSSNSVTQSAGLAISGLRFYNNYLYAIVNYSSIEVLNPSDLTVTSSSFITDGTNITSPYSLDINTTTGDVYIGDAKDYVSNGEAFIFDKTGKKKFSFAVASASPIKMLLKP